MNKVKIRTVAAGVIAVAAGLLLPLAAAAPAQAAPNCTWYQYDRYSGAATAGCSGSGQVRFVVNCNAIPGFTPWTKYSPWITISGGLNPTYTFPSCPYPAGAGVRMQYL